jgi:hypothetical protein
MPDQDQAGVLVTLDIVIPRLSPSGGWEVVLIRNYLGPLRFTQKREEEDDHTESPAKPTTEEDLVCAR